MKLVLALSLFALALLTSCAGDYGSAQPGFYKPTTPSDPGGTFGVFVQQGPKTGAPPVVEPEK